MQYYQNSKVKTKQNSKRFESGIQVKEIVFDKQITQSWKIQTSNPIQLLPYSLRHLYLSRICDCWHQLKFIFHENYEEINKQQVYQQKEQEYYEQEEEDEIQQVNFTQQMMQRYKKGLRQVWKILRKRLVHSMDQIMIKVKQQSSYYEEQSSQLDVQNIDSYMRFLRLQENKRIDLAIENLDSVVQKNTRRKLLQSFLNLREQFKRCKNKDIYKDKIKIECFIDIVYRIVKKRNKTVVHDSMLEIYEFAQSIINEQQRIRIQQRERQIRRKQIQKRKKQEQEKHFISISRKKVQNELNQQQIQHTQTINRFNHRQSQQKYQKNNSNKSSTIKRQTNTQKFNNKKQMVSEYDAHIQSSIKSHYYYDKNGNHQNQSQQQQGERKQYEENAQYEKYANYNSNINSLPTRRGSYHSNEQNKLIAINGLENNVIQQTLVKKTNRISNNKSIIGSNHTKYHYKEEIEPSPIKKRFQNESSSRQMYQNHKYLADPTHIPITQRLDKHHYRYENVQGVQYHDQEHSNEKLSQEDSSSQEESIQQIYVIRNFTERPNRIPDRMIKVPVVSSNIAVVQVPMAHHYQGEIQVNLHSNSYYQRKTCEGCNYCQKLKNINQFVQNARRNHGFGSTYQSKNHVLQKNQTILKQQTKYERNAQQKVNLSKKKICQSNQNICHKQVLQQPYPNKQVDDLYIDIQRIKNFQGQNGSNTKVSTSNTIQKDLISTSQTTVRTQSKKKLRGSSDKKFFVRKPYY